MPQRLTVRLSRGVQSAIGSIINLDRLRRYCQPHQFGERFHPRPVHDRCAMIFNGSLTDTEISGDILVELAVQHPVEHLVLALCQTSKAVRGSFLGLPSGFDCRSSLGSVLDTGEQLIKLDGEVLCIVAAVGCSSRAKREDHLRSIFFTLISEPNIGRGTRQMAWLRCQRTCATADNSKINPGGDHINMFRGNRYSVTSRDNGYRCVGREQLGQEALACRVQMLH